MKGEATGLPRGERVHDTYFLLETNPAFVGFDRLEPAGNARGGVSLVNVIWEDGATLRRVEANTPAYTLVDPTDRYAAIALTLERADHIKKLHLAHGESGSYFTPIIHDDYTPEPITLEMVMRKVAESVVPDALGGDWFRRTLEMPSGDLPGREGIASLESLLERGIISQSLFNLFFSWHERIAAANLTPGLEVKIRCIEEFKNTLQNNGIASPLTLKLVREAEGGVVVPHVSAMPRLTNKMMVELTRDEKTGGTFIHTIAPGKAMPRHPIRRLYRAGKGVDMPALRNAAWLWSQHAHVEPLPDKPPYLERTLTLLQGGDFRARFTAVHTQSELAVLANLEPEARAEAERSAKQEVKEFAALRIGATVQAAKQLKREWQELINEAKALKLDFTNGLTLQEYSTQYHLANILNSEAYAAKTRQAREALAAAEGEARAWLDGLYEDIEAHRHNPRFINALNAWLTSPDSTTDRGHDGLGYNAGLLHFFEYRGALHKRRRFHLMDEPSNVEGFMDFTERLVEELERVSDANSKHQAVIIGDTEGNQRIYILLPGIKGEFIVAFRKADQAEPKLTAMFNRVTQQSFERMVEAVLSGQDRGQINRLGPGIQLLYSRMNKI